MRSGGYAVGAEGDVVEINGIGIQPNSNGIGCITLCVGTHGDCIGSICLCFGTHGDCIGSICLCFGADGDAVCSRCVSGSTGIMIAASLSAQRNSAVA